MNKYLLSLSCLFLSSCDDVVTTSVQEGHNQSQKAVEVADLKKVQEETTAYRAKLTCDDGDVYYISMGNNAKEFKILLNDEVLIDSKELTFEEKEATKEVVQSMYENIKMLASAEEFLTQNTRRMLMKTYSSNRRNVIQVARMKSRLRSSKEKLLEDMTKMMEILIETEDRQNGFIENEDFLLPQCVSKKGRLIVESYQNIRD